MNYKGMEKIACPLPVWKLDADQDSWREIARDCAESDGRLVALWGSAAGEKFLVHAALVFAEGMLIATCPAEDSFPGLEDLFFHASRMQRAIFDLCGVMSRGGDRRPWLDHGKWQDFPLGRQRLQKPVPPESDYPFVSVEGEGVHEIAVGPVHAGIIEPGHFRFQVVGEKVLRLEERLGYKHKGIEKAFEGLSFVEGNALAGRISGDSTVAFSWAYAMAAEAVCRLTVSERASLLRGIFLERERIANHLGDLGALGNDAGFSFGLAQFSTLKEEMLRANKTLFGHRYLMDRIVPGGVSCDLDDSGREMLREEAGKLRRKVRDLREIYMDHTGLQDRFMTTGRVGAALAARLGLSGLAGRASGICRDLRADHPAPPYAGLAFTKACERGGDVAARVLVRFGEIESSLDLCLAMLEKIGPGEILAELPMASGFGAGWVEGFRGEVFVAVEAEAGILRRVHAHDPSWQNWPVLEHAVIGNIVPDFPLINKSFNLSYSGHDL